MRTEKGNVNRRLTGLVLAALLFLMAQSWAKTPLPAACGDGGARFEVTTTSSDAPVSAPDAASAQIVLIETVDNFIQGCVACNVTVRMGMDGEWIGANKGNSYFAFSVAPGEHHLCANWQSSFGSLNKVVGLNSFTAAPGKTYYFQAKVRIKTTTVRPDDSIELLPLNEDEAKYLVKTYMLSTAIRK